MKILGKGFRSIERVLLTLAVCVCPINDTFLTLSELVVRLTLFPFSGLHLSPLQE